jgi:aminopeptidase N
VNVKQTQFEPAFILPVAIDVYNGKNKIRHDVWVDKKDQTFTFAVAAEPDLVNFDGDKILLCEKKETGKSLANYIHQYYTAGLYVDRREAISACALMQDSTAAVDMLKTALKDRYHELSIFALHSAD